MLKKGKGLELSQISDIALEIKYLVDINLFLLSGSLFLLSITTFPEKLDSDSEF